MTALAWLISFDLEPSIPYSSSTPTPSTHTTKGENRKIFFFLYTQQSMWKDMVTFGWNAENLIAFLLKI